MDELREYVCSDPEADVDGALDEGLPGYMRERVRTASHTHVQWESNLRPLKFGEGWCVRRLAQAPLASPV